jgi:hypothetical protein
MIAGASLFTENGTLLFTDYRIMEVPPQTPLAFYVVTKDIESVTRPL